MAQLFYDSYPIGEIERVLGILPAPRREFLRVYKNDRVAFLMDCVHWPEGEQPTPYQLDIAGLLDIHDRVAVCGPHGLGKTTLEALLIIHHALTCDAPGGNWKAITTAAAWRQLKNYLWPEIYLWLGRLRWDKIGREPLRPIKELLRTEIRLNYGQAFAVASDTPELLEGAHAPELIYTIDEAKAVNAGIFDAIEGAFSNAGNGKAWAKALALSTPGQPSGRFWEICAGKPGYEDWIVRYVTLEETIKAGRNSPMWAEQRARQWGESSTLYKNRVLGIFAEDDANGLIKVAELERAHELWHLWNELGKPGGLTCYGVDVAAEGVDKTVFAPRYGDNFDTLQYFARQEPYHTAIALADLMRANGGYAVVDVVGGYGYEVASKLRRDNLPVDTFQGNDTAWHRDALNEFTFANRRAEAFFLFAQDLKPDSGKLIALPEDANLDGELMALTYHMTGKDKLIIDPKEQIKKRLGRSPDAADAVVMAWSQPRGVGEADVTPTPLLPQATTDLPAAGKGRW